ncbi:MAG TPA: hypothetical protein VMU43_13575 [Candidatus Acidoferrum sp.]|nr:hypothetical protein [Candidatus Acidoferrum sp.]
MLDLKSLLLCALLIVLAATPLFAQRPRIGSKAPINLVPTMPDDRVVTDKGISVQDSKGGKICSIEPFPGLSYTVSVTTLQVPAKAEKEYEKACSSLKNRNLPETEQHLLKATQIYPNYVAGWVMLGQVYDARQQVAQAHDACAKASAADPKYLPAYLCLAEIAGREQKWSDVLNLTNRALELDPANDAYAYFFSAIAYFNLNQLPVAETTALKAEGIDKDHHEPLIQYLLSQIYGAKSDSATAALHMQEYERIAATQQANSVMRVAAAAGAQK